MLLLWIPGVLALLLFLLCLTRIGILVTLGDRGTVLVLRIGPLRFQIVPGPERSRRKEKAAKEEVPKEERPQRRRLPGPSDLLDALRTLPGPLRRALRRIVREIRIRPLSLDVSFGGEADPASAAVRYGCAHAAVWTLMPRLEEALDIPDPWIGLSLDTDAPKDAVRGEIGVSARIGTLLIALAGVGTAVLGWIVRTSRRGRRASAAARERTENDGHGEDRTGEGRAAGGPDAGHDGQGP